MGGGSRNSVSIPLGGLLLGFITFAAHQLYTHFERGVEALSSRVTELERRVGEQRVESAVAIERVAHCCADIRGR